MLKSAWHALAELLFPAVCIGCASRGVVLCDACRRELPKLPQAICPRCIGLRTARGVCRNCRQLSPALIAVRAALAYEGAARTAVLTLKFRGGRHVAPLMGDLMVDALKARPVQTDLLVPVPLAPGRLKERGYNQALLLTQEIARAISAEVIPDALIREDRPPQQTLNASTRLTNLDGAVRCVREEAVRDRRVLVVDDVVTTGATLSACADALKAAGAGRVWGLAFARDL